MQNAEEPGTTVRNIYRPEDYFSYNITSGVIRDPLGTRMLTLPEELLLGIHTALDDETGAAAPIVLYQCGRWWGRRFIKRHFAELRHFYQRDAGDMPIGTFLHLLRSMWGMLGWGRLELSLALQEYGFVEVTLRGSVFSDVIGNQERPSEQLVAGLLASLVSELAGRELECAQTACKSAGDEQCTFLIGISSRVSVINAWVRQGRNHATIVTAIREDSLA